MLRSSLFVLLVSASAFAGENAEIRVVDKSSGLEVVLPEGWKRGHADSLGQLHVALLMNELEGGPPFAKIMRISDASGTSLYPKGNTRKVAEGWDGDQVVSYLGPDGRTALLWASRWDTERDAEEFATAPQVPMGNHQSATHAGREFLLPLEC